MPGLDDKKLVKKLKKPQAQPQSIEAEESVLGAILLKPSLINEVKEFIPKPDIFYFDTSRIIWNKMVSMSSAHEEIDIVTIRSKLSEKEKEKVSAYYLSGLSESMPTTANIAQYAKIVLEKFLQRELINATYEIQKSAFENTEEFESLIKLIKKTTDELSALSPDKEPTLDQIINETIESIETSGNYVKFGFKRLDKLAGGMTKGEVTGKLLSRLI